MVPYSWQQALQFHPLMQLNDIWPRHFHLLPPSSYLSWRVICLTWFLHLHDGNDIFSGAFVLTSDFFFLSCPHLRCSVSVRTEHSSWQYHCTLQCPQFCILAPVGGHLRRWSIVCGSVPHMQVTSSESRYPHFLRDTLHRPVDVLSLFLLCVVVVVELALTRTVWHGCFYHGPQWTESTFMFGLLGHVSQRHWSDCLNAQWSFPLCPWKALPVEIYTISS